MASTDGRSTKPGAAPGVTIVPGDRGDAVRDLRSRLSVLGFTQDGDPVDTFGAGTEAAVRSFQSARGLRVDGVCGPQTWSALVESGYGLGDRLLYRRQPMLRGDDVADLQQRLNALGFDAGREDGMLGPDTERALREFQRNAGVTTDGICGPETLGALERLARGQVGSVAQVRERDELRRTPHTLAGRRVFVAVEPGLEAIAEVVRQGLAQIHAHVVVETATDDQSALAVEANEYGADLVLVLRLGDRPGCSCSFYGSGSFRSERGSRVASFVLEEVVGVLGGTHHGPEAKTYAVLRETRAPAVVCEPAPADDAAAVGALVTHAGELGRAIVAGIRRASEGVPGDADE